MKSLKILFLTSIIFPLLFSCNAQSADKNDNSETTVAKDIQVYYFHFTRRCPTCIAVEEKTLEFLKETYADQMENGTITFKSLNLDEDKAKEIAEKLGVSGQCLLFVKGDEKVDLTSEGFMNARSNPEKLQEKIKETIDGFIL
ncbi:MAG: hypothetical protein A2W99_13580 [Bacteroidetes bacterium GWF2_33_16]|nr:MAG: hypothetical protein A2X00_08235 [Bacteroidetes bacterium GWE2_32_14]OFY06706.1 MAG: hypothetical protein A2W99_13580 [Bacteroidetes bacterium GWF2_33_16]